MPSLKPLLLTTFLSLSASTASAAAGIDDNCPTGWLPNTFKQERCCPGGMVVDEEGAYCCVQDMRLYKEALTNTKLLYPTATTTSASDADLDWTKPGGDNTCYATVRFSASDYSAKVSSALSEAEATPTDGSSATATTGTGATRSGTRATAGSQTASRTGATASMTATATATENSNAGVLFGPAEGLLGGLVIAVGGFML